MSYINGSKTYPKTIVSLLIFSYFLKRYTSFNTINKGCAGQRALKLLAVKVEGLKKKSTVLAFTAEECTSAISSDSSSPGVESFSMFDGW